MLARLETQFGNILETIKKQLQADRSIVGFNGLLLLLFLALAVYVKTRGSGGQAIAVLFSAPFSYSRPYFGLFTTVSNFLLCISTAVCLFTFNVLKTKGLKANGLKTSRSRRQTDWFLLASALVLLLILLDRAFRLTIVLYVFAGVGKGLMYLMYGLAFLIYGWSFGRRILNTPYALLIIGVGLLVLGSIVDMLHLEGQGAPAMLEDGTKLLGILNLTLYFWQVCKQALFQTWKRT